MTTTDPEYDRLRDAVIADWAYYGRSIGTDRENDARQDAEHSSREFRDYRTRSTPPAPVPLRVEPPEGTKGDTFHWLADEDRIEPFCWTLTRRWQGIGRSGNWTAETVADDGWRYHSVASPCKPDTRIEPTDEAIQQADVAAYIGHAVALLDGIAELDDAESQRDLANAISLLGTAKARCDRFSPPSRIEVSEEAIEAAPKRVQTFVGKPCSHSYPARSPTQPAPVQQGPISAESEAELSGACIGEIRKHVREGLGFSTAFADDGVLFAVGLAQRAVLAGLMSDAKPDMQRRCSEAAERYRTLHEEEIGYPILPARPATPTITKDQWEEIRKLAITQAPQVFAAEARKVIGL